MCNPFRFISLNSPINVQLNYAQLAVKRDVSTLQSNSMCHVTSLMATFTKCFHTDVLASVLVIKREERLYLTDISTSRFSVLSYLYQSDIKKWYQTIPNIYTIGYQFSTLNKHFHLPDMCPLFPRLSWKMISNAKSYPYSRCHLIQIILILINVDASVQPQKLLVISIKIQGENQPTYLVSPLSCHYATRGSW